MTSEFSPSNWQIPTYRLIEFAPRRSRFCVCIPIINEGERILSQLDRMKRLRIPDFSDVLLLDGGSTDGSMEPERLRNLCVRSLLVKTGPGRQGAQLRMGWSYALLQDYEGIVTLDGNGKDGVDAIPGFLAALEAGYDFVQGSRYLPGGVAVRTPLIRSLAIKLIHAPVIRLASGFPYSDTTNAFRGYSRRLLLDSRVQPFREVFSGYEMLAYMSIRAPQLSFRTREIPVRREYPASGSVPTKISHFRGNLQLIRTLWLAATGRFAPR